MKRIILFLSVLSIISCCHEVPQKLLFGTWDYKLFINDVEIGTATMSNKEIEGNYVSISEFRVKMADVDTLSRDTVTETKDFKPLKLESYNKIVTGGQTRETLLQAAINGREVLLTFGKNKSKYKVDSDFIIDGNYFMSKLIEGKFSDGLEISANVFHPSVEPDRAILVKARVLGRENIMIMGKEESLIHVIQSIENIEKNIDLYIDSTGAVRKGVMEMMNLKIEFIKI